MRDARHDSLLPLFRSEVAEHLDVIARFLDEAGAGAGPSALHREALLRVHAVKGAAQSLGLGPIARAARRLEEALVAWGGSEEARRDPAWAPAMGRLAAAIRRMADEDGAGGGDDEGIAETLGALPGGARDGSDRSGPHAGDPVAPGRGQDEEEVLAVGALISRLHEVERAMHAASLTAETAAWRTAVRDRAAELGRDVALRLDVEGVELDRVVVDRLRGPLLGLLENAVEHGIEGPAERRAAGKPSSGTIELKARLTGSMARIEVSDDGRGIDRGWIVRRAVERGFLDGDGAVPPEHALYALLFSPGFTARDAAGAWSGRGGGLHLLARAIEQLGGHAHIVSAGPGRGAAVTLILPVSVATQRALLVRAGDAVFALPSERVARAAHIDGSRLAIESGQPVLREAGGAVPVIALAPGPGGAAVLVERGPDRLAVTVDEVIGVAPLVVRPMPWDLREVPGAAGSAVLDDGSVAIVLQPEPLFEVRVAGARLREVATLVGKAVVAGRAIAGRPTPRRPRVLVADDSLTARALARKALLHAGYEVTLAVDGAEAAELLAREPFDALVSDVEMPGLDGLALTRRVREDPRLGALPVVIVTSHAARSMKQESRRAGANEYVEKGERAMGLLLAALARHLGRGA